VNPSKTERLASGRPWYRPRRPGCGGSCSTMIATFFMRWRKRHGMPRSAFSTRSSNSTRGSTHHHRIAKTPTHAPWSGCRQRQKRRTALCCYPHGDASGPHESAEANRNRTRRPPYRAFSAIIDFRGRRTFHGAQNPLLDEDEPVTPITNGHGRGALGPVGSVSYSRSPEGSGGKAEFECAGTSCGRWQAG